MKNLFKTIAMALVLMCSTSAMAQEQGQHAAGVNFGFMSGTNGMANFGIGIKYGYMVSDNLRFEANGMYYFPSAGASLQDIKNAIPTGGSMAADYASNKDTNWFDVNINAHYLFHASDNVSIYPIFGFAFMKGHTSFKWSDKTDDVAAVNALLGKNYSDLGKVSYSDHHFRFGCNLGVGAQYNITDDFGITLEAKYKLMKTFGNFNAALGCVVLF